MIIKPNKSQWKFDPSHLDTVEFKENNGSLLRKVNFPFMIPNPSLNCFFVVLNFWPYLSLVVLIKKACLTIIIAGSGCSNMLNI